MDWQSLLKTIAPWIGTAIGGPLGGMAVEAVGNALGLQDKTVETVKQALSGATPEQMLAVKKADQDFAVQMQSLGYKQIADLEAIAAGDRKSARDMQMANKSRMPAVITIVVALAFFAVLGALFAVPIPAANRDMIIYMCGQLAMAFAACLAFWVGTTRQSEDKTHMLAQSAPVK